MEHNYPAVPCGDGCPDVSQTANGGRKLLSSDTCVIIRVEVTMFKNPEVALNTLPTFEELEWQHLHPNYKRRLRVQHSLVIVPVIIFVIVALIVARVPVLQGSLLLIMLVIPALALFTWPAISVPRRGYVIRDRDILFRSGVFWRSVTAVPFNRIQHVETSHTPLDRHYKISTLQIFTAGGSKGDLKIVGLGSDVAE